jgi:hypothetical protein
MESVSHSLVNSVIGKPSDMTDIDCGALPVMLWRDPHGPWATSFWKPTATELAALSAGGCIGLNLRVGPGQHPVTSMVVYMPEADNGG